MHLLKKKENWALFTPITQTWQPLKAIQSSKFIIYAHGSEQSKDTWIELIIIFSLKSPNNRDLRIKFSNQPINIRWPTCIFYLLYSIYSATKISDDSIMDPQKKDSICTTNCLFFVKINCLVSFKSYKSLSTQNFFFLTNLIVPTSKLTSTKHQLAFTLSNQYLMHHNHPIRITSQKTPTQHKWL